MFSVVPLDTCISNYNDFQLFHLISWNTTSTTVGFNSFNSLVVCETFLNNKIWGSLIQMSFLNTCKEQENLLRILILENLPLAETSQSAYIEE